MENDRGATHWNYRILVSTDSYGNDYYALYEVFYTDNTADAWTADPIDFGADSPEDVLRMLKQAVSDCERQPVLRISGDELVGVSDGE